MPLTAQFVHRWPSVPVLLAPVVLAACGLASAALGPSPANAQTPTADKPRPAREAAARMKLPPGFQAVLVAGEPDLVQPIAFTFDERGRLWVVECHTYPTWSTPEKPLPGRDRVSIFADQDGDGRFDKKTVFLDGASNLSGIEVGYGGVWLTAVPELRFIPDRNRDDRPDGPAQVLLDGWDLKAKHNVVNGLAWGPDGWLYGLNGILSNSLVGKPGAPESKRQAINCGVWRYHPVAQQFEPYAFGTTNPWGLDWDAHGELFITNCVIKHLFHVTPGGRYERMFGQDLNPHAYGLIESCADHIHWGGGHWTSSRGGEGPHDVAGGGHAHSGCLIYQGENWPAEYRDLLFTCNIHGARVNADRLQPRGSGFVATHEPDFLFANDPWFRGLAVKQGPGGMVWVSDWCDTGECHDYQEADIERGNGRLYRVSYGPQRLAPVDLGKQSDAELLALVTSRDEWLSRTARRLLAERAATGALAASVKQSLAGALFSSDRASAAVRLRLLWTAHACGEASAEQLTALLADPLPPVRGWAATLLAESAALPAAVAQALAERAAVETAPAVQLRLIAAAARLPLADRQPPVLALLATVQDANDPNLPLLLWYALEPLVAADPKASLAWLDRCELPLVRRNLVQRVLAALPEVPAQPDAGGVGLIVTRLSQTDSDDVRGDLCAALRTALAGNRTTPQPAGWAAAFTALSAAKSPALREQALALAAAFGDAQVLKQLRETLTQHSAPPAERLVALQILDAKRPAQFARDLQALARENPPAAAPAAPTSAADALRTAAIRALAGYDDAETPRLLLQLYPNLPFAAQQDALQTLASREAWALALLDSVDGKTVPRSDVTAVVLRQLQASKWVAVKARLDKVWGQLRPPSQAKKELAAEFRRQLTPETLRAARVPHGRQLFTQHCAACHKLFGEGGQVGPELTGAQRQNLDYLLDNVLDPSAVVAREYQTTLLLLGDGRVLTGIVVAESPAALTLQTANERVIVPRGEIDERQAGKASMMPEGIFERLTREQVRDLVAYLQSPVQTPPPQ